MSSNPDDAFNKILDEHISMQHANLLTHQVLHQERNNKYELLYDKIEAKTIVYTEMISLNL